MAVPTQFAYRTSKDIGVFDTAPVYESLPSFQKPEGNLRCCAYSPCGRYFAWASPEQVSIVDASVGHVITTLEAGNVYELGFSPKGTFIITWQRPSKDDNGDAVKNLLVWRIIEAPTLMANHEHHVVGRFVQKSQTGWNLQYTRDEKYCARTVTNEVQFYESGNLSTVWNHLRVEGVSDFAVSPGETHSVAVFVPERKGNPASVQVFNVPNFSAPVSRKNFFKADKVQLKWNSQGSSLIVLAQTEVDKSNKSYYGETTMYLLSANGEFDARVDLDKEGPIYDVTWSPNSTEFGVVYGYMPAKTTIFNTKAIPTYSFPSGPRNTIVYSPHGRFVLLAGFGNLAGIIDIFDVEHDYAKVSTIQGSNTSVCEWAPDGQYILTATTSPRLRVDNGIRLYHVTGGLMYTSEKHELYHVCWRPQDISTHPLGDPLHNIPAPHDSALSHLATVKTPSKPAGAYRPPGARGTTTPLAFMREDQGGSAFIASSDAPSAFAGAQSSPFATRRRPVPGAEAAETPGANALGVDGDEGLSKAALKNKKKREAKKAKDAAERAGTLTPATGPNGAVDGTGTPVSGAASPARSPDRRDSRADRDSRPQGRRSRANSELRPRSQNRNGPGGNTGDRRDREPSTQRRGSRAAQHQQYQQQQQQLHQQNNQYNNNNNGGAGDFGNSFSNNNNNQSTYNQHPRRMTNGNRNGGFNGAGNANNNNYTPNNNTGSNGQSSGQSNGQSSGQSSGQSNGQSSGQPNGGPSGSGALPNIDTVAAAAGLSLQSRPDKDAANGAPDFTVTSPGGSTPLEKKIRALTKKLRAIDDLKMRRAGGEKLEATQMKKMDTEDSVRRELEGLGYRE